MIWYGHVTEEVLFCKVSANTALSVIRTQPSYPGTRVIPIRVPRPGYQGIPVSVLVLVAGILA
eukprot:2339576-Rhodomonas_salina.1